MTKQQHPITPPQELLQRLRKEAPVYRDCGAGREEWIATEASRWGWEQRGADIEAELQKARDEELEAICEYIAGRGKWFVNPQYRLDELRAARRPKPKSQAKEALQSLDHLNEAAQSQMDTTKTVDNIRRALERLQDLEGQEDQ